MNIFFHSIPLSLQFSLTNFKNQVFIKLTMTKYLLGHKEHKKITEVYN